MAFGTVYAKNSNQSYKDWSVLDKNVNYMIHRDQLFKDREKFLRMYLFTLSVKYCIGSIKRIEAEVLAFPIIRNLNLFLLVIKISSIWKRTVLLLPGIVEYLLILTLLWIKRLWTKGHKSRYSRDPTTSGNQSILLTTRAVITTLSAMRNARSLNRSIATSIFNRQIWRSLSMSC